MANLSTKVIQAASSPSGLLYDVCQPELATLVPEQNVTFFSPNDLVQLSNTLTVAERADDETATRVLEFAMSHAARGTLRKLHLGRSGEVN